MLRTDTKVFFSQEPVVSEMDNLVALREVKAYIAQLRKHTYYRNPFLSQSERDLQVSLKEKMLPKVRGIIIIGNKRLVIINGKSLKEGDSIGKFSVYKITSQYVLLKKGKRFYRLFPE
ncbi:MAG: general secretion pathway protein GspB [Candidatus Desulfofervidaceae bacterium]|nr:general secretion pathway protein GspB [Candidatus Desulfofervidaceae bacterium]